MEKKVKIFKVFPKGGTTDDEYEAILWPKGRVFVGIDVWRLLNPDDITSYKFEKYESLDECLKDYKIKKICRPYYVKEEKNEHS